MAWKTGGLFDEEGLPAEMQDTDIRQVLGQQQPHDMGSVLSLIGWTDPHAAGATTVDWTQVTSDNKASSNSSEMLQSGVIRKLRPLLNVTLAGMPAVVKSTAPTSHFNLDLSADMLQRLIAETSVLDDLGVGSLPTPPPAMDSHPLGQLVAPLPQPSPADHLTYSKRRRLSSESVEDDTADTPGPGVSADQDHDDKYRERRRKNNIASRRSRELRKQKMETTEQRAQELEKENKQLRARVEELERTTRLMKDLLLQRLTIPHP